MADHLPRNNGPPISWRPMSSAALFCRDLHRRSLRHHGHVGATLEAGLERDMTVAEREKRMVLAHAYAFAGMEFGAALAHDHIAAGHGFTAEQLDAQHFGIAVATIARRTACFLVCHDVIPLTGRNVQNFDLGEMLAM